MATTGLRAWTWVLVCTVCASQPVHGVRAEEPEPPAERHHHRGHHARKVAAPAPRPLAMPPPVVQSEPPPAESAPPPLQAKRGDRYGPAFVTFSAPRMSIEPQRAPPGDLDQRAVDPPAPPAQERLPEPPMVGAGGQVHQRVDLSRLQEVEDRPIEGLAPGDVRLPQGYTPPRRTELPYLGEMSADPELRFVPESPSTSLNPRLAWDDMMAPPPPTAAEVAARRLRNIGIALLVGGALECLISVPMIATSVDLTAVKGTGYGILGVSLGTLAAGGAVLGVGEQRLRAARRAATGMAGLVQPGPRLLLGRGLALEF